MRRHAHGCAAFAAALAAGVSLLLLTPAAVAAGTCGDAVLLDWSDNGRIDKLYALHCYDEAIDAMPTDLRDYTNASEVISRALAAAARSDDNGRPPSSAGMSPQIDTSGRSSVPIPLVALAGLSLVVLAAGGLGYVSRRRRHDAD
jgi:hypothetical protein